MNIEALKLLREILKVEYSFFLFTSRLNQDSLENLFSVIRGRGGHRDNPDPVHFHSTFKQVLVQNMFVPAPSSNCEDDSGEYLLKIDDFSVNVDGESLLAEKSSQTFAFTDSAPGKQPASVMPLLAVSDVFAKFDNDEMSDGIFNNTLTYIAGYICCKVLDKHDCVNCQSAMLRSDTSVIGEKDLFCVHKAYNSSRSCFGVYNNNNNNNQVYFVLQATGSVDNIWSRTRPRAG